MRITRKQFVEAAATVGGALALQGCLERSSQNPTQDAQDNRASARDVNKYAGLAIDMDAWNYDEEHDVYYQLGIKYCLNPVAPQYEQLAIYVPGPYFTATAKGKTYSASVNPEGVCGPFTASSAPLLFPVNCSHYAAQMPQSTYSYEGLLPYLTQGCVYVFPGCRGRSAGYVASSDTNGSFAGGIPYNVVDLKAALRFLRFNAGVLPGNTASICGLGVSAGALLVSLLGVSGNEPSFDNFLDELGAAYWDTEDQDVGDELNAVSIWSPQLALPALDAAYEWFFGQYIEDASRQDSLWTSALSRDLAATWAAMVSALNVQTGAGKSLSLEETSGGIYTSGSFYTALVEEIEDAARSFFATTTFPVQIQAPSTEATLFPGGSVDSSEEQLEQEARAAASAQDYATPTTAAPAQIVGNFESATAYVRTLNANRNWLTYAPGSGAVRISSIAEFVRSYITSILPCTAYDSIEAKTVQNQLFCTKEKTALHFSRMIADLLNANMARYSTLESWSDQYMLTWMQDLEEEDEAQQTVEERANLTDHVSYLDGTYKASIAPAWRIRVGLAQNEVPLNVVYLFSRLLAAASVPTIDFAAVWGQGLTLCERTGDAAVNLVEWLQA